MCRGEYMKWYLIVAPLVMEYLLISGPFQSSQEVRTAKCQRISRCFKPVAQRWPGKWNAPTRHDCGCRGTGTKGQGKAVIVDG